jgi:diguanylate cyclase (GGDEF)-like protein/PAS domain S-box-containing protein
MEKLNLFRRFLLPLMLVGICSVLLTAFYMFNQNLKAIEDRADLETNKLAYVLKMAQSLVGERVTSSMALLKETSQEKGEPSLIGTTTLSDEEIPSLFFGFESETEQTALVDGVIRIGSGTATIFVKKNEDFVRIATNVRNNLHQRVVGTRLDPKGKAIGFLRTGKPFYGVVDILGEPYISGYEPIQNSQGEIIGAWYVGYKVNVNALDQIIKKWRFLKSGFVVITDYNQHIRFLSETATETIANNALKNKSLWLHAERDIPEWGFHAYIFYPENEAYLASAQQLAPLLLLGGIFGFVLFMLARHGIRKFVVSPIGGEPETAIQLVRKMEQGNFEEDGIISPPDTLISNMLKMRSRVREMVNEIKNNSDRLSISSSVFQHANDGIFITDISANIIDINPAFTTITGYSKAESVGKNPQALGFAYQMDAFYSHFFESTKNDGGWRGEIWNMHRDGTIYVVKLDVVAVHNETGEFQHYVGLFSNITHEKEQQKSLEHMAYHDSLTQLPNRLLFSDRLQKTLTHVEATQEAIAICYIDLDNFKPINDKYGHETGDQLLKQLAERLRFNSRKHDTVARLGGDEFALLLGGEHSPDDYRATLDRVLTSIEEPFFINDKVLQISASIGYTVYPHDNNSPDILLRHADHAMYHAKTLGGKQYHLFDLEMAKNTQHHQQMKQDIYIGIRNEQFILHYQPQINIKTGALFGMEALIRWQHPEKGLLPPDEFLPLIEHSDLISELTDWVILSTLKQIQIWQNEGFDFHVAINIPAFTLTNRHFAEHLAKMMKQYPDVPGRHLNLEITESAAIHDIENVTKIIKKCNKLGVTFSLDDFGVGYSSLIYLRRLPVDIIKLDRTFIHDMLTNSEDLAVVSSVLTLCREFKREAIAEGVETAEQAKKLIEMDYSYAQGFGISIPMPADEIPEWIKSTIPFKFPS